MKTTNTMISYQLKIFDYTCILFAQLRQENRDHKYSMKIGQNLSHYVPD